MYPHPVKNISLTDEQLFELNDAVMETITRMVEFGQTTDEVRAQSLPRLWEARLKIVEAINGPGKTYNQDILEAQVNAAIQSPVVLKWSVSADGVHVGYVSCVSEDQAARQGGMEFNIPDGTEISVRLLR
ncbi:hypothetical protein [Herbaspirillum sp.]|uniref:hypothetical protein n=1 Tax=Herbaspirillum sp. TaxID=1890675 RepID=UPI000C09696D|nr:hypothetical protein [Herbaspirillum sp.]MAF04659.1 hypothetical protein [Herbaspirillum sp.]|tara:strand:+ start:138 stop:527 length:390 start_codon:yes stop_codon:yes gene_type:complete